MIKWVYSKYTYLSWNRSNCKEIVDECIDWSRTNGQFDSSVFCDIIVNQLGNLSSPIQQSVISKDYEESLESLNSGDMEESNNCIDIKQFGRFGATSTSGEPETLYNVCKNSKCGIGQLCLRNQDCSWNNCPESRCVNVCTIGKCFDKVEAFFNNYILLKENWANYKYQKIRS